MDVDYPQVARTLVHRQARVKPGEVVKVNGGTHNLALIEEIAVEVRKAGGHPMVSINWESLHTRLVNEVDDEHLELSPDYQARIEGMIDCIISVAPFADPRKLAEICPKKSVVRSRACKLIQEANVSRGARRIGAGYPTPEQAEMYGLPYERFHEMFWTAAAADVDRIYELCSKVRSKLRHTDMVQVISPSGDELTFSIKGRRINMDDGVICDDDLASGDVTANFPFGEVYCAPIEETVEGAVQYPVVFSKGKEIRNLRLVFEGGHMVSSSAETNHEAFLEAMAGYSGDADRIGELGIGTNHEVHEPTGNLLLDEKIFGSVHLALGENRSYGGVNRSSCHWDMVVLGPTVLLDGEPLLEKGKFA